MSINKCCKVLTYSTISSISFLILLITAVVKTKENTPTIKNIKVIFKYNNYKWGPINTEDYEEEKQDENSISKMNFTQNDRIKVFKELSPKYKGLSQQLPIEITDKDCEHFIKVLTYYFNISSKYSPSNFNSDLNGDVVIVNLQIDITPPAFLHVKYEDFEDLDYMITN